MVLVAETNLLEKLIVHLCPECEDDCDCDLEDHWNDVVDECSHVCDEEYVDDEEGYDYE